MALQQPVLDLDELTEINAQKRLYLAFGVGLQGYVSLNDDREAMVTELIRLAKIGQRAEAEALVSPGRTVAALIADPRSPS